ncbi:MAG: hypothetical protein II801_03210 [Bacteroidaceae bacterium]|nr:hypothetical protein [Bacteroidaceae bacterium]
MTETPQTERLLALMRQRDWDTLDTLFGRLTNTEFRRTERIVRDEVLTRLTNDEFWAAYLHLIIYKRQAFLSGIRAVGRLAVEQTLRFDTADALQVATTLDERQALKVIDMALPLMQNTDQVDGLFSLFHLDDERQRVTLLIRIDTPLAYYMLFRTLCHIPDNRALALRCYRFILRRQNDRAYNMGSILRTYFGLHEAKEQLSLRIEPYELSYLDRDYERFCYVLDGKRPKV